jgi:hypothetical protein
MNVRAWITRARVRSALPYLVPALALFALLLAVFLRRLDPDFGWHLQAGRYILQHGVPAHDIFSYTAPNFPWINHEWLSDVLLAVLQAGGFWLVAAVFAAVWTAAIMLAAGRRMWLVYAFGLAAVIADAVARPNAWTALFFALLLWMLRRGVRWPIVALFALWANLHGGFVIGLLAVAVAAVRERQYWPVLGAAVLATFVNPYGPTLYVEIWRTLTDTQLHSQIKEWEPLRVGPLYGFYIVAFLFVVMASKWRYEFVLPVLLLAASVSSQRQFPLFVVASLGLIGEGYRKLAKLLNVETGWRSYLIPAVITVLALVPVGKIVANPHNELPDKAMADLRAHPCRGQVFNEYDYGGYIVWQLPGTRVYIDGRMPSWRQGAVDYLANWKQVLGDEKFARRELAHYDVNCALVEVKHDRLADQLKRDGWRVAADDGFALLLRRD